MRFLKRLIDWLADHQQRWVERRAEEIRFDA